MYSSNVIMFFDVLIPLSLLCLAFSYSLNKTKERAIYFFLHLILFNFLDAEILRKKKEMLFCNCESLHCKSEIVFRNCKHNVCQSKTTSDVSLWVPYREPNN